MPAQAEHVYQYVYENTPFNFQNISNVNELFYYASHLTNLQVSEYFRSNIYRDNSLWIARTLSSAQYIRTFNPNFMLQLVRSGDIRSNAVFTTIRGKVGTPLVVNQKGEAYFSHILNEFGHSVRPEYLWVFKEIKSLMTDTKEERNRKTNLCQLKGFCEKSCIDAGQDSFTDYNCYASPWLRADETIYSQGCAFAVTWKAWGLQGRVLQFK